LNINRPSPIDAFWVLWQSILIAIFAIAAFIVAAVLMVNVVGRPQSADMTQYNYLQGNLSLLLVSLAGVYIVSSFGEEVIYRGFLMTRLERIFGGNTRSAAIFALATSSIIFGLAHYKWGAMGIVQSTCMGFAMGASFLLVKRRLWPLILAHALMDTLLLVPLYLAQAPSS
jgi:membrane protease YdiL (CAAX protease family)